MRWFNKEKRPEVWEVRRRSAARRYRLRPTRSAISVRPPGTIAERLVAAGGRDAEKQQAADAERYQAAIKRALEIAMQISDDSMRDVSVSQIIKLCVQVDHLKTARVLLRTITVGKDEGRFGGRSPEADRSGCRQLRRLAILLRWRRCGLDGAVLNGKVLARVRVEIATVTTTAAANSRICSVMVSSLKNAASAKVTKGCSNCICDTRAMPPIAMPRIPARRTRSIARTARHRAARAMASARCG